MNQQPTVTYPTIDLFLYDLREGLGQDEEKVNENRQHFWQKIYPNLNEKQLKELADKEKAEADYIELLIPQKQEQFQSNLEGYYYALQLGDAYALQLDCSLTYPIQGNPLSSFTSIKYEIDSLLKDSNGEIQKGRIGQTWFVWCQLEKDYKDLDKIAEECCKQLSPNPGWVRDLQKQGELAGATLFELWHSPDNWADEQSLQESFHLIIGLFPYRTSRGLFNNRISRDSINDSIANLYFDLIRLFCYRHKILWAYHQSRCLKADLKKDFTKVQQTIQKVRKLSQQKSDSPNLNELQSTLTSTLTILSRYAIDLNYLDDQGRTIKVNLENYKKRLKKITDGTSNSQSELFKRFSELASQKYLVQVETDYANLSPGLVLLENLITTIEGIIEIYQTKSDRTLNTTIAIAGIGLATSQIASAVILTQDTPNPQVSLAYRTQTFAWSLGIGAIAVLISLIILRLFRH